MSAGASGGGEIAEASPSKQFLDVVTAGQSTGPAVRLIEIEKAFGSVKALNGVSLDVGVGEVHAILGENGAGKTTLMSVLCGLVRPDKGSIEIRGKQVTLQSRRQAMKLKVGIVRQSLTLIEELSVIENYMLGHPRGGGLLKTGHAVDELIGHATRLGFVFSPHAKISQLSTAERQQVEIAMALSYGAQVLILDEPTSALGGQEFESLAPMIRTIASEGKTVLFISHKLREALAIADRLTVMRRGQVVATHAAQEADPEQLIEEMVGSRPAKLRTRRSLPGPAVVELTDVWTQGTGRGGSHLQGATLAVRGGETLGVAAVAGNGERDLADVLVGTLAPYRGSVRSTAETVAVIPEDRSRTALAVGMSVADNIVVHRHRECARNGWLDLTKVARYVWVLVREFQIVASHAALPVSVLSGGNQQKLVHGRELAEGPSLVVAHNPNAGLDVLASQDVKKRFLQAAVAGAAVVLISTDLDELFEISDRLVVLYEGVVVGDVNPSEVSIGEIGKLMTGIGDASPVQT